MEKSEADAHEAPSLRFGPGDIAQDRQMFDYSQAVKLLIDPDTGQIVDANAAACRYYGYSPEEIKTHFISDINTLSVEEVAAEMSRANTEQRVYFNFRHRLANGTVRDVEVRSSPVYMEGRRLLYSVVHDVTERRQMESAQQFMMEVSAMLAASLDYSATLYNLARLIASRLADICIITLLDNRGAVAETVVAARDPALEQPVRALQQSYQVDREAPHGIAKVLRIGQSELLEDLGAFLEAPGAPDILRQAHEQLKVKSYLAVPLVIQGRPLGCLSLMTCGPERPLGQIDLRLAEGLARRAAVSLSNARLYEEAQAAVQAESQARRNLEEMAALLGRQARELNAIIEAIPDGVFVCDEAGNLTRLNARAKELFWGVETGAAAGLILMYTPEGRPLKLAELPLFRALDGETVTDFRAMIENLQTGQPIQLRISFAPIRNETGLITGAVAIASDVTRLHRLEKQKDEFLSIVSHELRTPITSIKGLTQLAVRRLNKAGHGDEAAFLEKVEKQVHRLVGLINELLDVSRFQNGKLEYRFEPFDLARLVRDASASSQETSTEHQIVVSVPSNLEIYGDAARLEQVLTNLLGNAIKYSPQGGKVEVTLTQEGETALLAVRDYGIGIPLADRDRLFERFERASNVTEHHVGGFGLGLYISSQIVEAHQGRIWLADLPAPGSAAPSTIEGQGSLFCVSLPLKHP